MHCSAIKMCAHISEQLRTQIAPGAIVHLSDGHTPTYSAHGTINLYNAPCALV
jgi:hypothetical protein